MRPISNVEDKKQIICWYIKQFEYAIDHDFFEEADYIAQELKRRSNELLKKQLENDNK